MESSGITIESIPTQVVRPMFLGGGEARVLTGDDFAQYLNLNNLNFKGFSKEAYIKNGQLPAGLWKFSVSVRHFYTNKTISNIGTVTAWITSYKPPVLTSPKEGEIAPSNAALPLTFSWQASKHTGGTAAIMYRFEMWERRIEGVPAQAVAASVPPIFTTETAGLTATVLPATLALEPGMKYCWRVTAYDPSGMVTIENKGESEIRTFQYLEKCPEVCGLTVDVKDDTGYASWEENRQHLGGYNFEFYDDEGTCHKTLWGSSTKTAGIGGEYGKTWHVRVQGICLSDVHSEWSDWVDFKIPDAFKPLKDENGNTFECGKVVPERVITNFTLKDNLQKGDTIENRRGTTKFVIHSATRNEDGSFRGLSYMLMRIWGVSFLGEFDHLNVNTDGVIIGKYSWRTVDMGVGVVSPEDIEKWADETALAIAGATYNNTIKDTVSLCCGIKFESIRREGNRYYALRGDTLPVEITSAINGMTRTLVKDDKGHELVIDKDGNLMGVEEYRKCGGSKALLRENIKEKDSQVTKSGNVKFYSAGDYLFDTYDTYVNSAAGYAERFPSIGEGDYRPAYACAESNTQIEIKAEPYENITFKNERGVPIICKGGILEVTARGERDTTSIYAYDADNHIVGKVNVLSYDKVTRKICLVPIGDTKAPDASTVKQGLDEIFAKLMVDFDVTIGEPIAIQYAKDNIFTHGGSGMIGVYNTDQKAAISKLKERGIDNETVYLFFVKECNALKANDSPDVVNGYMPRGYQFGFIYNELNNYRTDAHEICHGAFHLKHTFAQDDFLAAERTTDNLMDYNGGETLNHWQWKDIHQPKSVRFKWLQDEEGAESIWNGDYLENRTIIESLRFAYAFGKEFVCKSDMGGISNGIVLGNGIKYDYLATYVRSTQNLNLKTCEKSKPFVALDNTKLRSGFGLTDQGQTRTAYAVEYETTKEQHESINKYIKCSDATTWKSGIDFMIKHNYWSNLSAMPEEAFGEITNNQRISILLGISSINNYDVCVLLALSVAKNINQENVASFFDSLAETDILFKLKDKLKSSDYEVFIKHLALAYINQNGIKERVANLQHVYTWHRGRKLTGQGDEITYSMSQNDNKLHIRGIVKKWTLQGQTPHYEGEQKLVDEDVLMTDLVGVYMSEGILCNLKADKQVYPMPAFFFDYLLSAQNKDDLLTAADALTTIASFAIGVGELKTATQVGLKFVLSVSSVFRLSIEPIVIIINQRKAPNDTNWKTFYLCWESFWTVLDIWNTKIDINELSEYKTQIAAMSTAWESYRTYQLLNNQILSEEEDQLNDFINNIKKVINEK